MAQLKITARKKNLPHGQPTFVLFRSKEGRLVETSPLVDKDGNVIWYAVDTDENREIFERNLAESGIYSVKTINQRKAEPFSVRAKEDESGPESGSPESSPESSPEP